MWAGQLNLYIDCLRTGRSGDRIPVGVRFSAPVQTGPGAQPASLPGVKSDRGVTCRGKERVELYLYSPLWAVRPAQSLSACTRVHFTFTFYKLVCLKLETPRIQTFVNQVPITVFTKARFWFMVHILRQPNQWHILTQSFLKIPICILLVYTPFPVRCRFYSDTPIALSSCVFFFFCSWVRAS